MGTMTTVTATLVQPMSELLERAGCALRGHNRADCAKCKGKRTVSYRDDVFCCHHAGCGFKGNRVALARDLGLLRRLSPFEYQAQRQAREEAERLAHRIVEKRKARRSDLEARHRQLLSIRLGALQRLERSREDGGAWDALALVYRELPQLEQELERLESI
jgi:recombinational DNA repair protein (RecF pathway)